MDRKQYEEDLAQRKQDHLRRVRAHEDEHWRPCLHDGCEYCVGTGIKLNGSPCVHAISCPCSKCKPRWL